VFVTTEEMNATQLLRSGAGRRRRSIRTQRALGRRLGELASLRLNKLTRRKYGGLGGRPRALRDPRRERAVRNPNAGRTLAVGVLVAGLGGLFLPSSRRLRVRIEIVEDREAFRRGKGPTMTVAGETGSSG
jgi:hypothetical protein